MKKSFIVYHEWRELFDTLGDVNAGKLIKAMFEYSVSGKEPKMPRNLSATIKTTKHPPPSCTPGGSSPAEFFVITRACFLIWWLNGLVALVPPGMTRRISFHGVIRPVTGSRSMYDLLHLININHLDHLVVAVFVGDESV